VRRRIWRRQGGSLHVVDFWRWRGASRWFQKLLCGWLARFAVTPRLGLEARCGSSRAQRGLALAFQPLYRRYAFLRSLGPK